MFTSVWKNEILLQRKPKVYVTKHLLFGINWFQRFCAPRDKKKGSVDRVLWNLLQKQEVERGIF